MATAFKPGDIHTRQFHAGVIQPTFPWLTHLRVGKAREKRLAGTLTKVLAQSKLCYNTSPTNLRLCDYL